MFNLKSLKNKWQLYRKINDLSSSKQYFAVGDVEIIKKKDKYKYKESGNLFDEKLNLKFKNFYKIEMFENDMIIYFDNNKVFFKINLDNLLQEKNVKVTHVCKNDTYNGVLKLLDEKLIVEWNVKGPNKNYVSYTEYVA